MQSPYSRKENDPCEMSQRLYLLIAKDQDEMIQRKYSES
jgi:hypothetical protein